jgi:hypothetical protein
MPLTSAVKIFQEAKAKVDNISGPNPSDVADLKYCPGAFVKETQYFSMFKYVFSDH